MALISWHEFMEAAAPIYWLRLDRDQWTKTEFEAMEQWIAEHLGGWVHHSDDFFAFERDGDRIYFTIWLKSEPFEAAVV